MKKILLASTCLIWPAALVAQPSAEPAAAQEQPQTGDSTVNNGVQDIIVTASRRAENVQKSALSIQAISSGDLARKGVIRPEDLSNVAPGVAISTVGAFPQTYIRGVGNYAATLYSEGAVAYNLDGIYISRSWATRGTIFDLDRVEVLKGPQGTLYGRNASGGAINFITKRPNLERTEGFVELEAGNYDLIRAAAAVNVPLSSTLAIRASGQIVQRNGYLSDGYDDDKTQSARIHLLWEPSADFSALLTGGYQHVGGMGGGEVLTPSAPGNPWRGATDPAVVNIIKAEPGIGNLLAFPKTDGYLDVNVYSMSGEFKWNFGNTSLTILPAYRDAKLLNASYNAGYLAVENDMDRQTSLEARLGGDAGVLKWVAGAFFFDEKTKQPSGYPELVVLQGINAQTIPQLTAAVRSYAGFGQATYSVTDRLRLTGGIRYTYERKTQNGLTSGYTFLNAAPPPVCPGGYVFDPNPAQVPLYCRIDVPLTGRLTYKSWTWKVGAEFDIAPRSMAYFNASTGFKSGGFIFAPPPNTFKPEKLLAFEGGIKNRFFDNKLQLNVEGFYWKYKNHQESHLGPTSLPGFFTFITENAGKATSYGFDVDISYRPTRADSFDFKVQYNKTKYDSFVYTYPTGSFGPPVTGCSAGALMANGQQTIDCSGFQLIRSPLWSGNASYDHVFTLASGDTIRADVSGRFSSGTFLTIDFLSPEYQKTYGLLDADLSYTTDQGRFTVTAYVRNITDHLVKNQAARYPFVSTANPLANPQGLFLSTVAAPRTFGLRARLNF